MNLGMQFKKTSLILACLLFTFILLILLAPAPSTVANGPGDNLYIMRGKGTAYNLDAAEEDPVPWAWYGTQNENKPGYVGNYPPIMAAKRVENGAVVAGGTGSTCHNTRWNGHDNPHPHFDDLLDCAFQWMVSGATKVLWYGEHADHGGPGPSIENTVYNDAIKCSQLIAALETLGYSVDDTDDDADTPITPSLLESYDILVIPQLQPGEDYTGGDPNLLPDSWVEAIENFVKGGGGLLIMEGSDYGGHNYLYVQNKILDALEFGLHFQSDQVNDPNNNWYASYAPICEVCSDTEIGSCYKSETGDNEIGMYSLVSLAPPGRWVGVSISPLGRAGENGETLTYTVKIINGGDNDDNFSLEATNDGGWVVSVDPENVFVKGKENENTATLRVTIPDNADSGDNTHTTVAATSLTDNRVSSSGRTGTERWIKPKFEFGEWTVASSLFPSTPGYGITVAGGGENIYIADTSSFLRYNTITGVWESLNAPDVFMNGCSLCWGGGKYIYALVGASYGKVKDPGERRYDFWRYDISTNNSKKLADTPWFQGPGDALAWVKMGDNEYLYAFLGTSSRGGNPDGWYYYPEGVQFWRYNIAEDNWDENLTPNPYGADDGASLAWTGGDNIYAFPGAYDEGLPVENERFFLRYSISGGNWVEMAKTPYNAEGGVDDGGSLAYPGFGNYIYALKGGDDLAGGGGSPGDKFWRYCISENNWEILDHIPAGVGDNNGRRLGVANGNIYCWRGSFGDGTLWAYPTQSFDVTVGPKHQRGTPCTWLTFLVTVHNTGSLVDNYDLWVENDGWPLENIRLENYRLENIAPCENKVTKLRVHIPENAKPCTHKEIVVTARSARYPDLTDNDNALVQVVSRYLHSLWGLINLEDPASFMHSPWHELYPNYCENYTLTSWEDTGEPPGLSPCDIIDITNENTGEVHWHHVKDVTVTIRVMTKDGENIWLESELGWKGYPWVIQWPNVVCSYWHEVYPNFCQRYHIDNWIDTPVYDNLDNCDEILLENLENLDQEPFWVHVEEVATDLVLCEKCGVEVSIEPKYQSGMPGENIKYNVVVKNTGTIVDNFDLSYVPNGWSMWIEPSRLENIPPFENKVAALTVYIPENTPYCENKEIVVIAESEFCTATDNDNAIAHQGYYIKENMPDLGQHCENWCWAAAAANSFWWYANHGYPQLIDNLENAESDNEWIDQWYPCSTPSCPGYRKLLAVIASHCLGLPPEVTFCHPVTDNQFYHGLQKFINSQGAPLYVHEILNPDNFAPGTIPENDGENVIYDNVTFENYKSELLRCQDVLLQLDFRNFNYYEEREEGMDHIVTGVSFFDGGPGNRWIEVSDPWTPVPWGNGPDHNNDNEHENEGVEFRYDKWPVVNTDPLTVDITVWTPGDPFLVVPNVQVIKLIYISPEVVENWTGWAKFELENLYKVSLEKDLQLFAGKKLVVKFYKYDNVTLQDNSVIENISPPQQVKENENVPHPSGLPVEIATLVLTKDNTADEIRPIIASFTVTKSILFARYLEIKSEYPKPGADKVALFSEYLKVKSQYPKAPA